MMVDNQATVRKIKAALDEMAMDTMPSGRLRHDGQGLPFSECEVAELGVADPFPCITIRYWPNGRGDAP